MQNARATGSGRRSGIAALLAALLLPGQPHAENRVNAGTPPERQVYFGDLHVHTTYSNDSFGYNNDRTPDVAYRYAKGEPVATVGGATIQLRTPLDFLAVTDHAEYLGIFSAMTAPEHPLNPTELGRQASSSDVATRYAAFGTFIRALRSGEFPEGFYDPANTLSVWRQIVETADAHYEPGRFTAFAGYEWTSTVQGGNMHRNVIFEGSADLPLPFAASDSRNPEDLWTWLERQRMRGVDAIAIPHNSNVSDGRMFALTDSFGEPIDAAYAARRTWNEPLVEITQQKGTSETHPALSPTDEFADFELFTELLISGGTPGKVSGSYVREAWLNGVRLQAEAGFNPFQFGVIGSSDNHSGTSAVEEGNYTGSRGPASDGTPALRQPTELWGGLPRQSFSAAGLTAVWAEENTRESLFAAMRRRETYGTTGTHLRVRLFAGWELPMDLHERAEREALGYARGVPMGGVLEGPARGRSPTIVVWAARDPEGANLDRIQIIKGWTANGAVHERIHDVALSDPARRRSDGSVTPVGNTVDVPGARHTNTIGSAELAAAWTDPDFDPTQPAFYYVRVIEIPTPRWTTFDAAALGVPPLDLVPATLQERAFTSPVWYLPAGQAGTARQP
ncbi:MAG: DUF3604 domain-containing protein [Pseudomonadales bacterium]|nr:DUF3604 domain-containing protein [Pseudomonadales bacterium]